MAKKALFCDECNTSNDRIVDKIFDQKEKESGITIHFVNAHFDEGEIIEQFKTELSEADTPAIIEQKVRALEINHYASVVERLVLSA